MLRKKLWYQENCLDGTKLWTSVNKNDLNQLIQKQVIYKGLMMMNGKVSNEWNWLVNWYKEPDDGNPKVSFY